jgi:hypothetical protein
MTDLRAFVIIIGTGVGFALGGGLLGYSLGTAAPAYYRAVFRAGKDPSFDPVQVGLGLGTTQGLITGLILGAIVVAVAWYNSRCQSNLEQPVRLPSDPAHPCAPQEEQNQLQANTQPSCPVARGCGTILAALVGLVGTVVAYAHWCDRGVKWFENGFPLLMAVVCGVLVFWMRRMAIAWAIIVLMLIVNLFLGNWYNAIVHWPAPD